MAGYTVLIIGEADRWWTSMTEAERKHGYEQYGEFDQALEAGGHAVVGGAELTRVAETRTIPAGGGPVTDGPFTETVEQVGGYYQVETDDLDGLLECCQILARTGDRVEVRPNVVPEDRPA